MTSEVFPSYTEAEVFADRCVHAVGITTGFIAALTLVIIALKHLPTGTATAVVIYALGMLAMFCFSAAYNLSRGTKRWLWRRCDHAAIFWARLCLFAAWASSCFLMGYCAGQARPWNDGIQQCMPDLPHDQGGRQPARPQSLWNLGQKVGYGSRLLQLLLINEERRCHLG